MSITIELAGEEVVLLPERGLFWARESMLMIADWHVGKAASLRASGIPVPDGDLTEEFERLNVMIDRTGARELMILGDLAHARSGLTADIVTQVECWIDSSDTEVVLVSGNHDRSAGVDLWKGMTLTGDRAERAPFLLCHEPQANPLGYVLAGHIHPAVRLGEGKRGGLRAPCFWFGQDYGVLPAFGGFTGGHVVSAAKSDRVFAIGDGEVIEVPFSF